MASLDDEIQTTEQITIRYSLYTNILMIEGTTERQRTSFRCLTKKTCLSIPTPHTAQSILRIFS